MRNVTALIRAHRLSPGFCLGLAVNALVTVPAAVASAPGAATYTPPTYVQAVTLSGDTPAALWYYPKDAAKVTREVFTWLRAAVPAAAPTFPKPKRLLVMDYMGPAQLSFTGPKGVRVTVYPAFYLAEGRHHLVNAHYAPDVLAYVVNRRASSSSTTYLRSSALYGFLRDDPVWRVQFQLEAFTTAEQAAVAAVLVSSYGKALRGVPERPGTVALDV